MKLVAAGVEGTSAYVAEEYVAAESLDVALRHYAPAPLDNAVRYLRQLGGAIDHAAGAGVVHGTLHPRDVFLTPDQARATGFGVASALEAVGLRPPIRRPYSAPERIAGEGWTTRADVFSLAAIAYELLTAKRVAGAGDDFVAGDESAEANLTPAIRNVLQTALASDPAQRYPSAMVLVAALGSALTVDGRPAAVSVTAAVTDGEDQADRGTGASSPDVVRQPGLAVPPAREPNHTAAAAPSSGSAVVAGGGRDAPSDEDHEPVADLVISHEYSQVDEVDEGVKVGHADDVNADDVNADDVNEVNGVDDDGLDRTDLEAANEPGAPESVPSESPPPVLAGPESARSDSKFPAEPRSQAPEPLAAGQLPLEQPLIPEIDDASDRVDVPAPSALAAPTDAAHRDAVTGPDVRTDDGGEDADDHVETDPAEDAFATEAPRATEAVTLASTGDAGGMGHGGMGHGGMGHGGMGHGGMDQIDEDDVGLYVDRASARPDTSDEAEDVLEAAEDDLDGEAADPDAEDDMVADDELREQDDDGLDVSFIPPPVPGPIDRPGYPAMARLERSTPPAEPWTAGAAAGRGWAGRWSSSVVGGALVLGLAIGFLFGFAWRGATSPDAGLGLVADEATGSPADAAQASGAQAPGDAASPGSSVSPPDTGGEEAALAGGAGSEPAGGIAPADARGPTPEATATTSRSGAPAAVPEGSNGRVSTAVREGRLLIRSTPDGARVSINGEPRGTTPLVVRDLEYGAYTVRIARPGFEPRTERLTVTRDRPSAAVTVDLTAPSAASETPPSATSPSSPGATPPASDEPSLASSSGSLYIDSRPGGAEVVIDGRLVGTTPVLVPGVGIGTHEVRLELDGYRIWTSSVQVRAGQRNRVTGSLERQRP